MTAKAFIYLYTAGILALAVGAFITGFLHSP